MQTVFIQNKRSSILDLAPVQDVVGNAVVLRPAGTAGDTRECFADAEQHPHVQRMKEVGWIAIRAGAEPRALPVAAPPPVVPAAPPPPVAPVAPVVVEEPPAVEELPPPLVEPPPAPVDEPAVSTEAPPMSFSTYEHKKKRR